MGETNLDLVRRGFEALSEGGVEALLPFIHPEFEVTTPPGLAAEPDTYRGPEGIRRYFDSFYDAMDDVRFDAKDFIAVGDRVVVPMTLRARGRTTGIVVEQDVVQIWHLRDRRAVRVDVFATLDEAMAATDNEHDESGEPVAPPDVDLLDALIAAYNTRDPESLLAASDPDCEWHPFLSMRVEGASAYRGHDGLRAWLRDLETMFSEIHAEVAERRELGDRLLALGAIRMQGMASGVEVTTSVGWLFEMRDGRMLRGWSYPSQEEALEAARLSD